MSDNPLLDLMTRISTLERRVAGMVRHGSVAEVNAAEGWVRLNLGTTDAGTPFLSPKVPYGQMAGALKVHAPPSVGQNMTLISPVGDTRQAVALPMSWNDANTNPGGTAEENVLTFGGVKLTITGDAVRAEIGGFVLQISGEGLALAGGAVGHNGQDIGSTHTHPGVLPGGGTTGTPIAGGPTP